MRSLSILLILISIALSSFGQSGAERIVDKFFKTFEEEGIGKGIDYIFGTNPWMNKKPDAILRMRSQAENYLANDVVGTYYGRELIGRKSIGDSYVMYSYMVKYDRQPFRFTFLLYNPQHPKNTWQLQNFSFDDNLDEELDAALEIQNLKQKP